MKKMMKKILFYIVLFCCWSCDDFLSVRPKAEVIEEVFFENREGFEDALYGVYSAMAHTNLYGKNLTCYLPEVLAQNFWMAFPHNELKALSVLNHEDGNARGIYNAIWANTYQAIGYTNNILKNIRLKDPTSMEFYDLYKGEALGLRAFMHFDLLRLYAPHIASKPNGQGIPYVKYYTSWVTPFKSVKEVYGEVICDLKEAESLLKQDEQLMVYPRQKAATKGFAGCRELHFNLYAAQATLARVYWMKGDLDSACIYAEKVINSGKFPLAEKTEMRDFVGGIIAEKEGIWGLYSSVLLEPMKTLFYDFTDYSMLRPRGDYETIYNISGDEGDDKRLDQFRMVVDGVDTSFIYRCMKIVNEKKIREPGSYKSTAMDGINLIRIPEMYLIAAENLLQKDPERAREYFDTFIASRGLIKLKDRRPAQALTFDMINKEWRKEFFQEGNEWYNMKRLNENIQIIGTTQIIPASDKAYTLLIPDEEFEYRYQDGE